MSGTIGGRSASSPTTGGTAGKSAKQIAIDANQVPANTTDAQFIAFLRGLNPRGPWSAATAYAVNDSFTQGGSSYRVTTAHTSPASFVFDSSKMEVLASKGADSTVAGPAGPSPFLLTGITGGSNNRLLYLKSDGVTAVEVQTADLDALNYKQLVWRDNNGAYWLPGALITEPAGSNLPADTVRAMQPKTTTVGITGPNWRDIDPELGIPTDLAATADRAYVEFGKNVSPTSWRFLEPRADGLAPNPVSRFDGLLVANYPRNAAISTARWQINQWLAFDAASNPAYATAQTTGTNYPYGAQISFAGLGNFGTRIATDQVTPQAVNGQVRTLAQKQGGNGTIGVGMRLSGTSGAKNGILCKIDDGQGPSTSFQIVDYINGTSTVLASHPNFPTSHGTFYDILLECEDGLIRAKAWPAGTAEPADWMLQGVTAQLSSGYFGVTANIDTINVSRYSTVVGNGAKAAASGAT